MIQKTGSPTLVDVALEAGVSLKTASRVLNRSPQVTPKKEAAVRAAMAKLSYRPNEMARGLKARRSSVIGLVVPNLADPFAASSLKAIQDVARAHGYAVILASSEGEEALEREEVGILLQRQVDGLILAPAVGRMKSLKSIIPDNFPVVTFDQPMSGSTWDCVTVTNRNAAREATEHLLGHRYSRILATGARPYLYTCSERIAGYRDAMSQAKLKEDTLLVDHESNLTTEVLEKALRGPKPPQAIFTLNWVTTMLTLRALRTLGKRLVADVALISFDDFELADMLSPSLTVVSQPSRDLGHHAAELLFKRMQGGDKQRRQLVTLTTQFHIRASCGCREKNIVASP